MRYEKKMNKYERVEFQKKKMTQALSGKGRYVFANNSKADLTLPKDPYSANPHRPESRNIKPGGTFEGDDYFFAMVRTHDLRLVSTIETPEEQAAKLVVEPSVEVRTESPHTVEPDLESVVVSEKKEKVMSESVFSGEQHLILDQPPTITEHGKVEHVVSSKPVGGKVHVPKPKKVNESPEKGNEVLLVEDPLAGVDILID